MSAAVEKFGEKWKSLLAALPGRGTVTPAKSGPQGESPELILDAVRTPLWIGSLVIILFFGILGIWSATAPLTGGTIAFGIISPDGNRRVVQHFEGGIIDAFMVRNGDQVEADDILVVLQDKQVRANFDLIQGQHLTLQAMLARLSAEQSNIEDIVWPFESEDVDEKTRLVMKTQKNSWTRAARIDWGKRRYSNNASHSSLKKLRGCAH